MAVWSKAPPLTARYLSSLYLSRIPAWACAKVASDLELGGGFRRVLRIPPLLTLGSHEFYKYKYRTINIEKRCVYLSVIKET